MDWQQNTFYLLRLHDGQQMILDFVKTLKSLKSLHGAVWCVSNSMHYYFQVYCSSLAESLSGSGNVVRLTDDKISRESETVFGLLLPKLYSPTESAAMHKEVVKIEKKNELDGSENCRTWASPSANRYSYYNPADAAVLHWCGTCSF